jgi:hypothetical protein
MNHSLALPRLVFWMSKIKQTDSAIQSPDVKLTADGVPGVDRAWGITVVLGMIWRENDRRWPPTFSRLAIGWKGSLTCGRPRWGEKLPHCPKPERYHWKVDRKIWSEHHFACRKQETTMSLFGWDSRWLPLSEFGWLLRKEQLKMEAFDSACDGYATIERGWWDKVTTIIFRR